MSGHKRATISISEDEYRRLHDAEMKLRFMPKNLIDSAVIEEQISSALNNHLEQVRSRQIEFSNFLSSLETHVTSIEDSLSQELAYQQEILHNQLGNIAGRLITESDSLLAAHFSKINELMEEENREIRSEIHGIKRTIDQLNTSYYQKKEYAKKWIDIAIGLVDFIQDNYDYIFFMPGAIEKFIEDINQAINNYDSDIPEAALSQAQQVYSGLSRLRVELEKLDIEWTTRLQSAKEGLSQLKSYAENSRSVKAYDLDGNELKASIDVNYWSNGLLDQVIVSLDDIENYLAQTRIPLSEINRIIQVDLPNLRMALEEAIYQSRLMVLNSQLRINIADLVVEALESQGYKLIEADYSQKDQRMAFSARVRNFEGNDIVIQVNPGDTIGKNDLHLFSLDRELRTEHELRQRSQEISKSLEYYGLVLDNFRSIEHKSTLNRQGSLKQERIKYSSNVIR